MNLKLDLHVHTDRSSDAYTRLDQLIPNIERAGLDGLAITDHNKLAAELPRGALIIPGIEISTREGHVIGLGLSEQIPRDLSGDETIRQIRKLGGVSIVAHPYDLFRSAIRPENLKTRPDAIEVVNSASMFHSLTWKRARAYAQRENLPQTAGSDSHIPQTIGRAFSIVDSESRTVEGALDALRRGQVLPEGRPYLLSDRLRKLHLR